MVQYYDGRNMAVDTDLITRDEADKIFSECEEKIKEYCIANDGFSFNDNHELALWINCNHEGDYNTQLKHIYSEDIKVIEGSCYMTI